MHLTHAFIQSDLRYIQSILNLFSSVFVVPGDQTHELYIANAIELQEDCMFYIKSKTAFTLSVSSCFYFCLVLQKGHQQEKVPLPLLNQPKVWP